LAINLSDSRQSYPALLPKGHSDPDLAMKMYQHGCRHFLGIGTSLIYHFARKTISRYDVLTTMDSKKHFEKKWDISRKRFLEKLLHRGEVVTHELQEKIATK